MWAYIETHTYTAYTDRSKDGCYSALWGIYHIHVIVHASLHLYIGVCAYMHVYEVTYMRARECSLFVCACVRATDVPDV